MISLLIVNYRSAELAVEAIRTARAASSSELEVVVVDNSCDPRQADALRAHAGTLIVSATNRGYAGAINDGRRACRGDVLVVSNPDVKFGAGSIDALASAIGGDVAVAGPALFWDDACSWHLPPSELHTAREKIAEVLASRSRAYDAMRDRRRIERRIAFWSAAGTSDVDAVSGAVMAISAAAFDDAGGFDERFALYFEENDFLRRVAERRKRIVHVPAARCRHIYNQSAAQSDSAGALYAASEMKYLEKWSGPFVARLLKRLERSPLPFVAREAQSDGPFVIEASPLASFATAAGHFTSSRAIELPPEVWDSYRGDALYLRVIDRNSAAVVACEVRYKS
jgi:N-acetylglucosaminyl-diphospho-decaprenol L-rhamnosyltransferase